MRLSERRPSARCSRVAGASGGEGGVAGACGRACRRAERRRGCRRRPGVLRPVARSWAVHDERGDPGRGEHQAGELDPDRAAVRLLAEQEVLVEGAHEPPHGHGDPGDESADPAPSAVLEVEQDQPEGAVLGALDEGDGYPLAGLALVGEADPGVGEVAAAGDHELRTEDPSEGPAGDERGHEGVGEVGEGNPGPPPVHQPQPHHEGRADPPETRQPALPDLEPPGGVARVVRPVGRDMRAARPDERRHEEPAGEGAEATHVDPAALEAAPRVEVGDVGGDGQAEAVGVKDEGPQVERGGEAPH